jgi:putative membrane protein
MRSITGTTLVVVALTATISALLFPIWSYADRSGTGAANLNAGSVNTRWGPLSAADRDFVVRVRLAGLWEGPAGQQAVERAPTPAIKVAGQHLVDGHAFLDARAREVAAQLGMELPTQPNDQQQGFLRTLTGDRDQAAYERDFANLVRSAHGKVFALVAQIRANTRNSLVRALADDANTTVLDHMKVLEATGFVDFQALALSNAATATASPTGPPPPGQGATPRSVPPVTSSPTFPLPPPASRPNPSDTVSPDATTP